MNREDVFNFSAGPSVLPAEVLQTAAAELLNYHGSGLSVMEMSHRSREFMDIFAATKAKLKKALSVPDTHEILFLQGGASLQFSMIPLNLTAEGDTADYAVTGNFSNIAAKEAGKYCRVNIAASSEATGFDRIPAQEELSLSPEAKYFYYCANNTIFGTAWKYVPETGGVPIVCDMSSEILSHPVDVSKFGIVYAGAQKNMAPAGLTVVIIDRSLAGHERAITPLMMSYQRMIDKDSMYNTPPCYNILREVPQNGETEEYDYDAETNGTINAAGTGHGAVADGARMGGGHGGDRRHNHKHVHPHVPHESRRQSHISSQERRHV